MNEKKRTQILIAESTGFCAEALDILHEAGDVESADLDKEGLLQEIPGYDAVFVRLRNRLDAEFFNRANRLRAIASPTTGLNHIDLEEAAARGVEIVSLKGEVEFLNDVSATAEHAFGLILALARNMCPAAASVARGEAWDRDRFRGVELKGKTLGIMGLGRLGVKVAAYGAAFGMNVVAYDIDISKESGFARTVSLETLLQKSDFVSLHIDYNTNNHRVFGAKEFGRMKPGAYFINTSRGELTDEESLLASLADGRLSGAALDVLQSENAADGSMPENDPLVTYAAEHDNLIITPHIGGCTSDSMHKTETFIARKLVSFLK